MYDTLLPALHNTLGAFQAELARRSFIARLRRCPEAVLATLIAMCANRYFGLPETCRAAICAFSLTGLVSTLSARARR